MNQLQLWRARAAHARRAAQQTRNEGQKSLLLLYAEECERKAAQHRDTPLTTTRHAPRLSPA